MKPFPAIVAILLSFVLFSAAPAARGQTRIDPALPEAPLPNHHRSFLFPDDETARSPNPFVPSLRPRQKFEIAWRTLASPASIIDPVLVTGFEEAADIGPDYGPGIGGAAERFGSSATTMAVSTFLTDGLLPTAFHQDPRYFPKGTGSAAARVWWAIRADAVSYGDNGRPMPNYSSMLGFGMASAIRNAYLPPERVSFSETMGSWGIKEAAHAGSNILREFGGIGAIMRNLKHH